MTMSQLSAPLLPHAFSSIAGTTADAIGTSQQDAATDESRIGNRSERAVELPSVSRAAADAEVAKSYAKSLAAGVNKTSGQSSLVHVPQASTMGRWRSQLNSAFEDPGFLDWARKQNLNTGYLKVDPSRGEITGYVGGSIKTFSLSDHSGWPDISRTLLAIAKVFAPEPGQELVYPLYGRDDQVPLNLVAQFYGEPTSSTTAQVTARVRQLIANPGFELPEKYVMERSDEALSAHQKALGDNADRHALMTALRAQVDDASGHIDLEAVKIPIDPRSSMFANERLTEMSVALFLRLEGNKIPDNSKQALEAALGLSFDLPHRAPGVESGGVKWLKIKLSTTQRRKLAALVKNWKMPQPDQVSATQTGPGSDSVLGLLVRALPQFTRKLIATNPSLALDQLIRSPKALELGDDARKLLRPFNTPTSAIESLYVVLVHELDDKPDKSRFKVAGYDLYNRENVGASPAEIIKRFIAHLEPSVGVEQAPIAARILLSAVAPEFLVKNIPPGISYGSHAWVNFCIQVSRIEQKVPGATANMTYDQVVAYGNAPPVSFEGEREEIAAMRDPLIAWGFANKVTEDKQAVTAAEVARIRRVLTKQQEEFAAAVAALKALPVTREALALEELKRVFPAIDPTLKVLQDTEVKHSPLSLLDIYMSGPIKPDKWKSLDEKKLPYSAIKSRVAELEPDISKVFGDEFRTYADSHKKAWADQFKYQLSLLPMADREKISQSDVTFLEVSRPFMGLTPPLTHVFASGLFWHKAPTEQELEELKGTRGLVMKVVGNDGEVSAYSFFPFEGRIVKEKSFPGRADFEDSSYFSDGGKGYVPGSLHLYKPYGTRHEDRDPPDKAGEMPGTYFSEKAEALAQTASRFVMQAYGPVRSRAAGVTELEKGWAIDEGLKGFFLSLVPFYDGIQDAIKGDVKGAVFNIGFDIFGFALPAANGARKASQAGKGLLGILKRGVLTGVGASVGYIDTVDIAKNLNKGAQAGYRNIRHLADKGEEVLSKLRGNYKHYDAAQVYKDGDIVKGFFKAAEDYVWRPTVAILKSGGWYAYNVTTKTPFGVQAAQFGVISALETGSAKS